MTTSAPKSVQATFAAMLEDSGKTQKAIALEVGLDRRNVISMMKTGDMKVPIDRASALARACGADPAAFTRLVVQEYMPEVWEMLSVEFGQANASHTDDDEHVENA
ncbi:helix-turn-helix transcriptional regulator [Albimonas sp. CAU 1670]|uniref:helix-turn-helix domain-containing protein n=1 Tax=Albimonas sp. CAU 1670 TaxID=3032599 RepID=UPI0023DA3CEA|nr:helix-turn-helix transcriptional regulator [Albimonas sp. CAU 1670]MDF2231266.1 helix-turn-helix transcriptional regulator [Albimonas sp. CAU 1670]